MFGIGKLFKKKVVVAAQTSKRFEKRDLMQATVGIALLAGWVSGSLSDDESVKIQKILANTPALEGFGSEVNETYDKYNAVLKDVGFLAGKIRIMREIGDVKGDRQEAEDVFVTGITVALADGVMDDAERALLEEIAGVLGLRLSTYVQE